MTASLLQINLEVLQEVIINEPLAVAGQRFGDSGVVRLKDILRFFKRCGETTRVGDRTVLTVFTVIDDDSAIDNARLSNANKFRFGTPGSGTGEITSLVVEIRADGTPYAWKELPSELVGATGKAIVYRLRQGVETFEIAGTPIVVPKVIENSVSQFLLHYFQTLREALFYYRDRMARTSTNYHLRQAWYDDNRLWFRAGPEYLLRRSLCDFLRAFLRSDDLWLRPEQNVDETHPVDIKIMWHADSREAIIEVKWIGKSRNNRKVTADRSESRAREGAKQLADYLERLRQEAAGVDARGYLVVFDGRRKGLRLGDETISRANGMHYSNREITYDPDYHLERGDFEEPVRMFLEPKSV